MKPPNSISQTILIITILVILTPIKTKAQYSFDSLAVLAGRADGDQFYHIALGHGDVNNDGYEDILVGAPQIDEFEIGYAKIYYGSADFDTIPDLIFRGYGQPFFGGFGAACAIAGDINADGYDDIIIGDPEWTSQYFKQGAAYLYYGGESMDTIPDMTFTGEYYYHNLGARVSGAGDVNGDGYDDWILSAPFDDLFALGGIYLYYGGINPDTVCDLYFEGESGDALQFDNPRLKDINGDGYDDLIFKGTTVLTFSRVKTVG